jgi:hypothetical protein
LPKMAKRIRQQIFANSIWATGFKPPAAGRRTPNALRTPTRVLERWPE